MIKLKSRVHRIPLSLHTKLVEIQRRRLALEGRDRRPTMAGLCLELIKRGIAMSPINAPGLEGLNRERKKSNGVAVSVSVKSDPETAKALGEIAKNGKALSETAMSLILLTIKSMKGKAEDTRLLEAVNPFIESTAKGYDMSYEAVEVYYDRHGSTPLFYEKLEEHIKHRSF